MCVIWPVRSLSATASGSACSGSLTARPASVSSELAPQGLAERTGRLRDLLQEVVPEIAAVDVARGDLRGGEVGLGDGQGPIVVGPSTDALDRAGPRAVEPNDLTATGRRVGVGRGLAVHAEVAIGLLDHPVGLARHDVRVFGDTDVHRLAAAAQRQEQVTRRGRGARRDGNRALELADGARGTPRSRSAPLANSRPVRVGITLASVVISPAIWSASVALRSAKLSTSPLSTATT